jgi:hypothetical protein
MLKWLMQKLQSKFLETQSRTETMVLPLRITLLQYLPLHHPQSLRSSPLAVIVLALKTRHRKRYPLRVG